MRLRHSINTSGKHCDRVVRPKVTGAEGPGFKTTCKLDFLKTLFTQQGMGTWLSSEPGKVKVVKNRNGTPPQLHCCRYKLAP